MTKIVGSIVNGGSGGTTFTLTNGSTPNRAVVVMALQRRTGSATLSGSDFDFDGAPPSQVFALAVGAGPGEVSSLALVWDDADLPATSGSYSFGSSADISTRYSIYEVSEADTTAIEELPAGNLAPGFTDPVTVNFATTDANSILFFAFRQGADFGSTIGAGDTNDQTVDNADSFYYIAHEADTNGDAQMSIDDGVNNSGEAAYSAIAINSAAASGPTIANIDTDNAVNQYQQAFVNVTDFTETITSVTLNGVACTVSENDPIDDQITIRVPGSLDTGSYDLVISGASETDTLSGVSYTQTHEYTAPYGLVDSNSLFTGIVLTENSYFTFVSDFSNGTLDKATAESSSLWGNDVGDIYTPDGGFTGDDTAQIELLYDDGTTSSTFTVTVSVSEAGVVVFSRQLRKSIQSNLNKSLRTSI